MISIIAKQRNQLSDWYVVAVLNAQYTQHKPELLRFRMNQQTYSQTIPQLNAKLLSPREIHSAKKFYKIPFRVGHYFASVRWELSRKRTNVKIILLIS